MAEIMRQGLENMILRPGEMLGSSLPTLEQMKFKVLLKGKRNKVISNEKNEELRKDGIDDDEDDDEDESEEEDSKSDDREIEIFAEKRTIEEKKAIAERAESLKNFNRLKLNHSFCFRNLKCWRALASF